MRVRALSIVVAVAASGAWLSACEQGGSRAEPGADTARAVAEAPTPPGVVRIVGRDFEFDAPAEIPSGWTTIRFENAGEQEHFAYVYQIPDSVGFTRFKQEVTDAFIGIWNRYAAGDLSRSEAEAALGQGMPAWFFTEVTPSGGAALTEPGETSQVTVHLPPGSYVIECYVKTPQGTWHTERGMVRGMTVTDDSTGVRPPEADVRISLSNYAIEAPDSLPPGEHTVEVSVEENPEGFNMHDVNLVRLDGETTAEEVVAWMDWMDLDQFRAPAPGHSLGGVDQMVADRTGYVTVELTPGRYLWVSEGYGARGMAKEFTVR